MKRAVCLSILAACAGGRFREPSQVTGDLRVHDFASSTFGNSRKLRVLVPAGYDAPQNRDRRYPVLYLQDGQTLFDPAASGSGLEWHADEAAHDLAARGAVPPLIIVGIDNAGRQRASEYLPYPDRGVFRGAVYRGDLYPRFLTGEVMPFVEARYRVATGPESTAVGGASLGGLISLYTAIARPGVFGRLLIESPSLSVDGLHVVADAAKAQSWPRRIWIGLGTNEENRSGCRADDTAPNEDVDDVRKLAQVLSDAGLGRDRVRIFIQPCAVHSEAAWASRFPAALVFLFGGGELP